VPLNGAPQWPAAIWPQQVVPSGTLPTEHAPSPSQTPMWQSSGASGDGQLNGVPPQVPAVQVSPALHALPSSHAGLRAARAQVTGRPAFSRGLWVIPDLLT
jgi:hypothetical protein